MVAITKTAAGQLTFLTGHQKRHKVKCCLLSKKITLEGCPVLSILTSQQHQICGEETWGGTESEVWGKAPSLDPGRLQVLGATLSRGSGACFAAAASAALQQRNPPADTQEAFLTSASRSAESHCLWPCGSGSR